MKKISGMIIAFLAICGMLTFAIADDFLLTNGGELIRIETATVAATGQGPVEIAGRSQRLMKITAVNQNPAGAASVATFTLSTRGGNDVKLFALPSAATNEWQRMDFDSGEYWKDGVLEKTAAYVATSTNTAAIQNVFPIWVRSDETLKIQSSATNSAVKWVVEAVVIKE